MKWDFPQVKLFCPGPTPVLPEVANRMLRTDIYHRSSGFSDLLLECRAMLKKVFLSELKPVILTASGTGGMEASLVQLCNPGDKVVTIACGKFGRRWTSLAKAYGLSAQELSVADGRSPDVNEVVKFVAGIEGCKAVFFQANETSTGAWIDVSAIAKSLRLAGFDGWLIVDAITGICAHELRAKEWGIDAVISGSQKGFGVPPGLSFVALSQRALDFKSQQPKFYFDLRKEYRNQEEGKTSYTPAIPQILALHLSLQIILEKGMEVLWQHHAELAEFTRQQGIELGFDLFAGSSPSNALTSFQLPAHSAIDLEELRKRCQTEHAVLLAGGQDELKGKIIRISHLGFMTLEDLKEAFSAIKKVVGSQGLGKSP